MKYLALDIDSIARTLDEWHSEDPDMGVLALLPEAEKSRLPVLQQACRDRRVPLAGALFPALVVSGDFADQGAWLLRLHPMAPTFLIPDVNGDAQEAAERIAATVEKTLSALEPVDAKPTLYLMFDGLIGHIASILDGLYLTLADRVDYAGVNAGSETFQPMPCLFDAERVIGNGVLALVLAGQARTVLGHGYRVPERLMTATSTEGNCIQSIDWRPAFEVYREIIEQEYGVALTRENFYQHAVHFPMGILRANDDVVVRIPVALTEDGALACIGEVPENAVLTLLRSPGADERDCVEGLAQGMGKAFAVASPPDLLAFYCAGRRMHLGAAAAEELVALQTRTGAPQLGGALSLGEIGSTSAWGYPMFHNATLVCTPWRRR